MLGRYRRAMKRIPCRCSPFNHPPRALALFHVYTPATHRHLARPGPCAAEISKPTGPVRSARAAFTRTWTRRGMWWVGGGGGLGGAGAGGGWEGEWVIGWMSDWVGELGGGDWVYGWREWVNSTDGCHRANAAGEARSRGAAEDNAFGLHSLSGRSGCVDIR